MQNYYPLEFELPNLNNCIKTSATIGCLTKLKMYLFYALLFKLIVPTSVDVTCKCSMK